MMLTFITNKTSTLHTIERNCRRKHEILLTETHNKIWEKSNILWNLLFAPDRLNFMDLDDLVKIGKIKKKYVNFLFSLPEFKKLYANAKRNKVVVEQLWQASEERIAKEINSICHMKMDIPTNVKVYVTPDKLRDGQTNAKTKSIYWSGQRRNDFQNYDVVYITHELFHIIFPSGPLYHAIQELICDNELRIRLNGNADYNITIGDKQYQTVGHDWLLNVRTALMPYWKNIWRTKMRQYMNL